MAQAVAVNVPERPSYGAIELKNWINKFTVRGFISAVIILLLFWLLYWVSGELAKDKEKVKLAPIVSVTLENLPPPPNDGEEAPPPPTQQVINTGPASRAGTPVPVPEAMIEEDLKEFASMNELNRASAEGGEGLDLGGFADNIDVNADVKVQVKEKEPDPDEFIAVEKMPQIDLASLQKHVKYPDIARRAGIEGRVYLNCLVGKKGEVKKVLIVQSDSELLEEAAKEAVLKYGVFTPAIQNGQPVTVWVTIPVNFRLR